jgi:hypothetical protein
MNNKPVLIAGCFAAALSQASFSAPASRTVPPGALALIRQVHAAAVAHDYAALEKVMIKDFIWSFGGDNDAAQALAAWRENSKYLQQLGRVTGQKCAYEAEYVECPANAGTDYRAGFKASPDGWRMEYFVAGD